jgi:hypothetical protein
VAGFADDPLELRGGAAGAFEIDLFVPVHDEDFKTLVAFAAAKFENRHQNHLLLNNLESK